MFDKCIKCERLGESCVPNLMLLPFSELIQWIGKRQKYLDWTNQIFSERSKVPLGTINRIKAGEYMDCKYSTIQHLLITLIGGTTDEFSCTEQVTKELEQLEVLEQQAARLTATEAKNRELTAILDKLGEQHRQDIRVIKAEYQEQIAFLREQNAFLKEQLKAWQSRNQ